MARIKIEDVVGHLDNGIKRALEQAVQRECPDAEFNRNGLFRAFKRAVGRKCNTWENVPDHLIEK